MYKSFQKINKAHELRVHKKLMGIFFFSLYKVSPCLFNNTEVSGSGIFCVC